MEESISDDAQVQVVLILDNREVRSKQDRKFIQKALEKEGVRVECAFSCCLHAHTAHPYIYAHESARTCGLPFKFTTLIVPHALAFTQAFSLH